MAIQYAEMMPDASHCPVTEDIDFRFDPQLESYASEIVSSTPHTAKELELEQRAINVESVLGLLSIRRQVHDELTASTTQSHPLERLQAAELNLRSTIMQALDIQVSTTAIIDTVGVSRMELGNFLMQR